MKTRYVLGFLIIFFFSGFLQKSQERPLVSVIDEALEFSLKQSLILAEMYEDQEGVLPKSYIEGKNITSGPEWWCSGFFPGVLWYLYEDSKNNQVRSYAEAYTARVEEEKYTTDNHDVGFMLYCSFGNGLRLTGRKDYKDVLVTGAKSLSTRFNPKVGLIRSWDFNKENWQYPVIIDNMMNLELLLRASSFTGDKKFKNMAISHADKTLENHYRDDFSSFHVVSYDTLNGKPHKKQTHQGYNDSSSWSRGQAWGLYGYTVMYRETGKKRYLDQAKKIARYLLDHPNMPLDFIPYWDLDDPDIPSAPRDASTAALMASAFVELSQYVSKTESEEYLKVVEKQIRILASPKYTASLGENGGFILKHSVGSLPHNSEVDVPLTYADYYYMEALIRYKKLLKEGKLYLTSKR
ncbi:glycoside hydrolase family 88 protein [Echinicola shivajiensis]|uniref:glycoside hydrolase family 88 protein n=1 Tax=Echinicola shivajiensis TaxID=1035916 RepID=UPI001BFC4FED|nr:glycoside hydrolase family 88 protein [Echinicola shivajiensis]